MVANSVHVGCRVHRNGECLGRPVTGYTVVGEARRHRDCGSHRCRAGIHCRKGGNVARAAGIQTDTRGVVHPCVGRHATRVRCAERHSGCVVTVAYNLVVNSVHVGCRVHRNGERLGRAVAGYVIIGKVRGHRNGGRHRRRAGVSGRKGCNIAGAAGSKADACIVVRPAVGRRATRVRRRERHGRSAGVIADHLVGNIIDNCRRRIHRDGEARRSANTGLATVGVGRGHRDRRHNRFRGGIGGRERNNLVGCT